MNQYYYSVDGQQMGPVSESELMNLRNTGYINDATLVWAEGMPQWAPYATVIGQSGPGAPLPQGKPDNGMTGAVLSTVGAAVALLLCSSPFGLPFAIAAIVKAAAVDNLWMAGQYNAAIESAKAAKKWTVWSVWGSVAGIVLLILAVVVLVAIGGV